MIEIGENLRDVLMLGIVAIALGSFYVFTMNYLNGK